jgi:putative component of toxin-antitoxin plasmid stabilization module
MQQKFLSYNQWHTVRTFKGLPYDNSVFTIIETPSFLNVVDKYLDENALFALKTYLANHPDAGEVVPGSGGVRKLRWTRPGMGKRGGARVIYFNRLDQGVIVLLTIYIKAKFDTIPAHVLKALKEAAEHE